MSGALCDCGSHPIDDVLHRLALHVRAYLPTLRLSTSSVISLNLEGRRDSVDPELGLRFERADEKRSTRRLSLPMQMKKTSQNASRVVLSGMKGLLSSRFFGALTLACTVYSLFAFDLNIAIGTMDGDPIVDYVTFGVFVVFVIELCLSLACVDGYFHFFLWLDIAATISLWFEISFLLELTSGSDIGGTDFALAKAGRAAKAGARAGRLASILRMIRSVTYGAILRMYRSSRPLKNSTPPQAGQDIQGRQVDSRACHEACTHTGEDKGRA